MSLQGKRIVAVGEVVWDMFVDGQVLGGAPVNVAYHLSCLGLPVKVISKVGEDQLGLETLAAVEKLGVSTEGIQKDSDLPTGQVNVRVGKDNEPQFDIVAPAAWDNINTTESVHSAGQDYCLLFGTLAQRDSRSKKAIRSLWENASYCFYDINLRPPFTTKVLVLESLAVANMVKLNEDELVQVGDWLQLGNCSKHDIARQVASHFGVDIVAVTMGKEGAWLLEDDHITTCSAEPVKVKDTVGAGDAFFAALIESFVKKRPWPDSLRMANLRGGYVASQSGATPRMPAMS